jgi:hypothetical protein
LQPKRNAGLLHPEESIAEVLNSGQGVAFREGCVHFDERVLQRAIFNRFSSPSQVIVLGSSTTMQLRSGHFPGSTFYNHSMRRAVFEDYLGIYGLYRGRGFKPARVVLGIDAWIWDARHWKQYWWPLHKEYFGLTAAWGIDLHSRLRHPTALCHRSQYLSQRADTVKKMREMAAARGNNQGGFYYATREEFVVDYLKRPDGSVGYHAGFRNRGPAAVEQTILESKKFPNFHSNARTQAAFEAFVEKLVQEGTRVTFFLPPKHPRVYELRGRNVHGDRIRNYHEHLAHLESVERNIRKLAAATGSKVMGSFDPSHFGCDEGDFYDWIHPSPTGVEKILAVGVGED